MGKSTTRLSTSRLLAYCGLTFPIVALGMPVTTFLPSLYAGQGGLGLATIGLIFMLARIWDVISDPIVGILIDKYQWRHGRRKAWIAFSIPLMCITALFIFFPERGVKASGPILLMQLVFIYTGWTFLQTAHQAWGTDLAPDYDERSRLFGAREIVNGLGSIFILALPALAGIWFVVDQYTEVAMMGWFLVLTMPVSVIIAFVFVPDKTVSRVEVKKQNMQFADIVKSLKNATLWRILSIEIATGIGIGVTSALFLFVAKGVAGFESGASSVLLVFFVSAIAGMPIWVWLSKRLEKHIALQIACVCSLVGNLIVIPVLIMGHSTMFVVMVGVLGLGFGAPQALLRSMLADQVDRETVSSGINKAGFYFAFMSTTYKMGQAVAIGVSFLLLAVIGFDPTIPNDPEHQLGLILVFTLSPALVFAICALLCRNYPTTREVHQKDQEILNARTTD